MRPAPFWLATFRQWVAMLPAWAVFLGGIIVALVFWKHCPRPSLLTLLAMLVLAFAAAGQPLVTSYLASIRVAQGWTRAQYTQWWMGAGVCFNLVRSLGYGLLLAAVFIGRRPAAPIPPTLPLARPNL